MLQVQGKIFVVKSSSWRWDDAGQNSNILDSRGLLVTSFDYLVMRCLKGGSISMNSRLSLCMSSESPGGVHWVLGRVATGAIYHELVLHLTSTFLSWQGNNQKGTFTWRDATFLTWTGLHKDFIMYVCIYVCSFTNAHFFLHPCHVL